MLRVLASTMTTTAKVVPIPKNGVDYRGKIVLAPMVRSGECPSRLMALRYGADLVWGPETIDKALIGTTRHLNEETKTIDFTRISSNGSKNPLLDPNGRGSVIYRLHPEREGKKLIYQIGSSDPKTAVQAAKLIAADVAGIDVNAGCPKPFSTSGGMGAALLKTPDKLCSILEALVKEVGIPNEIGISVKIRLLGTPHETESLVGKLCATGITGLTIHCRTTTMRPRECAIRAQLKMIARVCREAGVACLMNGDVTSRDEALSLISEYGVDGAMIATAAETNPSVFQAPGKGGSASWQQVVNEYLETAMEVENRYGNTKYLLGQMIPGKQLCYRAVNQSKSYSELVRVLGLEAGLGEMARRVDEKLEIGAMHKKMTKAEKKAAHRAAAAEAASSRSGDANACSEPGESTKGGQSLKRTAEMAQLEMPQDIARTAGPGTVLDEASALAV